MKVAVVVGVAVEHDAISSAALEQVSALKALPEVESVHLYTQWTDRELRCPTLVTGSPWEMIRDPDFRSCDVAIFHWGIRFALFDAITLLGGPDLPIPVVHFHNCTPPSLVEESHRENIVNSIHQLHHVIERGTSFWTYSEFKRRTLIDWGAPGSDIDWVTFPISTVAPRVTPRDDDLVHLLSVGRLVPAKGAHVLIDALAHLPPALLERIRVRIVSATTFSSDGYRGLLDDRIRAGGKGLADAVEFIVSPSDSELAAIYADTDVLVSTSFHEGLCVPVIEAYSAGCRAIGTTAGNLPYIVIPPDPVVPPGEPTALAAAIERLVKELGVVDPVYDERRRQLIDSFSTRSASAMLRRALGAVADRRT